LTGSLTLKSLTDYFSFCPRALASQAHHLVKY
jgi:hypothetical protein